MVKKEKGLVEKYQLQNSYKQNIKLSATYVYVLKSWAKILCMSIAGMSMPAARCRSLVFIKKNYYNKLAAVILECRNTDVKIIPEFGSDRPISGRNKKINKNNNKNNDKK